MVMRGARRKGVRYFGPYGQAYAIRETLDLLLRTFPIRTCSDNKFTRHHRLGPAVPAVPHREVLGSVRRGGHPRGVRLAGERADPVPRRRHRPRHQAARTGDAAGVGQAGVRARRPPARPAGRGQQGDRETTDRHRHPRGLRRHRHRRRRARGRGPGVLRAARARRRAQGSHGRQGRGAHAGRPHRTRHRAALLRPAAARRAPANAGADDARRSGAVHRVAVGACARGPSRSGCRSAATNVRCRRR